MQSHPESRVEIIDQRVKWKRHLKFEWPGFSPVPCTETLFTLSRDPFVIFSGGLPQDRPGRSSSITVIHGRNTTVLEMEHNVVDFVALCDTPWTSG